MIQLTCDAGFIAGLFVLGAWLERVGGMIDALDKFFTPLPLAAAGMMFVGWNLV